MKEQRDDEMTEREPVGAVADKRKVCVGLFNTEAHECNPASIPGKGSKCGGIVDAKPAAKKGNLVEQGKRCQAAQNKSRR